MMGRVTFYLQISPLSPSPNTEQITDQSRMAAAGWVPCRILGFVVSGGSMLTGRVLCWISAMEGLPSSVELSFGLILGQLSEVLVLLLPNGFGSWFTTQSLQWETVVCWAVISPFLVGLFFTLWLLQSVQSQFYLRWKKQLAKTLAAHIEEKGQPTDKICAAQKDNAEMETSLEKAKLETESLNIPSLTDTYREMLKFNLILMEELSSLAQELDKERVKLSKQEEQVVEMFKELKFLKTSWEPSHYMKSFQTSQEAKHQALMALSPGVDLGIKSHAVPSPPLRPPKLPGHIHPLWWIPT